MGNESDKEVSHHKEEEENTKGSSSSKSCKVEAESMADKEVIALNNNSAPTTRKCGICGSNNYSDSMEKNEEDDKDNGEVVTPSVDLLELTSPSWQKKDKRGRKNIGGIAAAVTLAIICAYSKSIRDKAVSDSESGVARSISTITGLSRAARLQLAAVLDEFWGQVYDFHGQATQEAKAKKFDILLGQGVDSRPTSSLQTIDASAKDYSEHLYELFPSKVYTEALSSQLSCGIDAGSLWSRQPFEQFGLADKTPNVAMEGVGSRPNTIVQETTTSMDIEGKLLQSVRLCIVKLLKLEGSDWLFRQNGGADEDLIDHVATREKFVYEIETREKNNEPNSSGFLVSSVPNCGEECIWRSDLIISFGVWCIHRILNLSFMECRPDLWGKYTYVLNRLQGIIEPAFFKPRNPLAPCFCLQVPMTHQQKLSPPLSDGMLPPTAKTLRGKCTTASTLLELIKDVELAISSRKGSTVAYPMGKENLASVLRRYKRRLSNKPVGTPEGTGSRKIPTLAPYKQ